MRAIDFKETATRKLQGRKSSMTDRLFADGIRKAPHHRGRDKLNAERRGSQVSSPPFEAHSLLIKQILTSCALYARRYRLGDDDRNDLQQDVCLYVLTSSVQACNPPETDDAASRASPDVAHAAIDRIAARCAHSFDQRRRRQHRHRVEWHTKEGRPNDLLLQLPDPDLS